MSLWHIVCGLRYRAVAGPGSGFPVVAGFHAEAGWVESWQVLQASLLQTFLLQASLLQMSLLLAAQSQASLWNPGYVIGSRAVAGLHIDFSVVTGLMANGLKPNPENGCLESSRYA